MGRATESKLEQIKYIQHRLQLLNEVGGSLDESAGPEDLRRIEQLLEKLNVKVRVFIADWESKR